jgi:magnesium-transporting ATPase (P-type)
VLNTYANDGYRVIACAYKPIDVTIDRVSVLARDVVEEDFVFLGI